MKINKLCYKSGNEWEEAFDKNWSGGFNFNGQDRPLRGHGSEVNAEMELEAVQRQCEPLCKERFDGVPMTPVNAGRGRVVKSYEHVFTGFENIKTCNGCGEK